MTVRASAAVFGSTMEFFERADTNVFAEVDVASNSSCTALYQNACF